MSLTTTDLANVNVASYNANSRYGRDFWVSPSGTGTYLRKQVTGIEADAAALKADVATLKADVASLKQTNAELKSMLATALAALPKA